MGSVLEAEGVNDIPPISRFGRNGKEHRDSACSCLWIHSKFIRHGRCWWDGRWELALVLLCRQCLHKPTADFEFENTSTESEHARKHARTQKSRTARSTGSTKHESMNRSKARIDRKIKSTEHRKQARTKAEKQNSTKHRQHKARKHESIGSTNRSEARIDRKHESIGRNTKARAQKAS